MREAETVETMYGGMVQLTFQHNPRHKYYAQVKQEDGSWSPRLWTPSATGIIDKIDDGKANALKGWAMRLMANSIVQQVTDADYHVDEVTLHEIIEEARKAPETFVRKAANVGNAVHKYAEDFINLKLGLSEQEPKLPRHPKVRSGVEAFREWDEQHGIEYLSSERLLYSVAHHYSGTMDILARVNGVKTIIDIKTSSRVQSTHKLQLAGYMLAYNEEFPDDPVENRMILHVSREGGHFTPIDLAVESRFTGVSHEDDIEAFKAARVIYRRLEELDKSKRRYQQ